MLQKKRSSAEIYLGLNPNPNASATGLVLMDQT